MIDLHAHVVLEQSLGAAGEAGPFLIEGDPTVGEPPLFRIGDYQLTGVNYKDSAFMNLDLRLDQMASRNIDLAVLSPNPLTFFTRLNTAHAIAYAKRHNDSMAELVALAPSRLRGFAQLPTQDPDAAAFELRRAVTDLGLLGAYIGTDLGVALDNSSLDPVYQACCDLDVPLFLHPQPGGVDAPARDERMARFDADLWLGFAYEEALAVATLVLGGVLTRFPTLKVCVSHGGGSTAMLVERMALAARTRAWATPEIAADGAVEELLGRLWWDSHLGGPKAHATLVEMFGDDQIVNGTNFAGWDDTIGPSNQPTVEHYDSNARRLLGL